MSETYYEKNRDKLLLKSRQRYEQKKEEIIAYSREWYQAKIASDPDYKKKRYATVSDNYDKNPSRWLYKIAKARAKKYSLVFEIQHQDIIVPEVCPVFGTPFVKGTIYCATLDKINPSLGYVKGNIQVLSKKANMMKSNASKEELEQFAKWVLDNEQ